MNTLFLPPSATSLSASRAADNLSVDFPTIPRSATINALSTRFAPVSRSEGELVRRFGSGTKWSTARRYVVSCSAESASYASTQVSRSARGAPISQNHQFPVSFSVSLNERVLRKSSAPLSSSPASAARPVPGVARARAIVFRRV
nr:hypothetical protein [Kribbella jejuensis]